MTILLCSIFFIFHLLLTDDATKAEHLDHLQSWIFPDDDTEKTEYDDHPWMTTVSLDQIVTTHDLSREYTECDKPCIMDPSRERQWSLALAKYLGCDVEDDRIGKTEVGEGNGID